MYSLEEATKILNPLFHAHKNIKFIVFIVQPNSLCESWRTLPAGLLEFTTVWTTRMT